MIVAFHDPKSEAREAVPRWNGYLDVPPWSGGDPDKPTLEYVNGIAVEKKMGARETRLANYICKALSATADASNLGAAYVGIELELPVVGTQRKPDVCYVSAATWDPRRPIPDDSWWHVCPDLTVEVVSPYELSWATIAKVQEYFAAGVKMAWLVFPNVEQVYVFTSPTAVRVLTKADDLTADPLVPGFRLPLAELFPAADESTTPSAP